jgi:hypothetical protein
MRFDAPFDGFFPSFNVAIVPEIDKSADFGPLISSEKIDLGAFSSDLGIARGFRYRVLTCFLIFLRSASKASLVKSG